MVLMRNVMRNSIKTLNKWIPLVLIVCVSITAWLFDLHHYFNFTTLKNHQKFLEDFIAKHFIISIILFSATYVTVVALSLPAATFMTLVGGFFFGQWIGTGAVVVSATVGACFLFLSARMASADLLLKKMGGFASRMQAGFQENAFSYLLTLRFIPLFPFVAVNVAAAFFQIPLKTFILGTFLGIIPGSFVYVSMGVALREVIHTPDFSPKMVLEPKIFMAFMGLGALSLLPVLYKRFKGQSVEVIRFF
jgi:uncharacterized membrane protein YdjX (TVP38/TMEM64 family)